MKKFDFNNKIALITGVSSGIGYEIANVLIKKYGCTVYGVARNVKKLEALREEFGAENFKCCAMDVTDMKSWEKLALFFETIDTSLDILVNCAGLLPEFASIENTDIENIKTVMDTNFMSCVYSCKILMKHMNKGGCIINVSSAAALCSFAGIGAYSASKSALESFSQSLAQECKTVSLSCVMPGFVKTDIMKNQNMNEKDKRVVDLFSADVKKTSKKLLRKVKRRKKRIVLGLDAHLMSVISRVFPNFAPKLFSWVIKKSGLNLFKNI